MFYFGCIEDRDDPQMVGRYRVRVVGVHTDDISQLPTKDLPWATAILPTTSASVSGVGQNPGLLQGSWCLVVFADENKQFPIILGSIAGLPSEKEGPKESAIPSQELATPAELEKGIELGVYKKQEETPTTRFLGSLTKSQYESLVSAIRVKESTNDYSVVNQLGYVGAYQFGCAALEDLGYVKKGTFGTYKSNSILSDWQDKKIENVWTGKEGCIDIEAFKQNKAAQDKAMLSYMQRNFKVLRDTLGVVNEKTDPKSLAGMLAIAHNQGAGKVKPHLKGEINKDGNGTTTKFYYDMGYLSLTIPFKTNEEIKAKVGENLVPMPSEESVKGEVKEEPSASNQVDANGFGFKDPADKYPKKDWTEPDTNRLVRNENIEKTVVEKRESMRKKGIKIGLSDKTWDEPPSQYNAQYPYNHVIATEAGHLFEMDDTPNNERISMYHSSGSFTETDTNGNRVNKIMGNDVTVIERDGYIHISGNGHIHLDGAFTLKGSAAYIEVSGFNVKAASVNFDTVDFNVKSTNFNVQSTDMSLASGNMSLNAIKFGVGATGMATIKADGIVGIDGLFTMLNSGVSTKPMGYTPSKPDEFGGPVMEIAGISRSESTQNAMEDDPHAALKNANESAAEEPSQIHAELEGFVAAKPKDTSTSTFNLALKGDIQLSPNYKLKDLLKDGPFPYEEGQHGLSATDLLNNLRSLCINVLEPLREKYGASDGFKINSCFRPAGNKLSQPGKVSQHEKGEAADISFTKHRSLQPNRLAREQFFLKAGEITNGLIPFDQVLLEYAPGGSVWIHISYKNSGRRAQVLTLDNHKTVAQKLLLIA